MVVEGFEGECAEGINVPVTENEPRTEQNPDQVFIRNICYFWWC